MIYVMSDTHGDLGRFRTPEVRRLKKRDTLIVLGDVGFLWDGSPKEQRALKWLGSRRYRLLFLDGSHENFDLLAKYPEEELAGAFAQHLYGNLYHLERGALYTIEGKKLLVFGGAESLDRETRREGETWWPQEMPLAEDYARCDSSLAAADGTVDYVLTHDAPTRLFSFLRLNRNLGPYEENAQELYFDGLMRRVRYKAWYFGRWHIDQNLGPAAAAVYRRLLPLWQEEKHRHVFHRKDMSAGDKKAKS